MEFECIVDLFEALKPLKRKYPMIVAYHKFLQKIGDDVDQQRREISAFAKYLLKNNKINERVLDDEYYYGTKAGSPIFFGNVFASASTELIEEFWTKLIAIEKSIFPAGRPAPSDSATGTDGAAAGSNEAAVMAIVESNPVLSELVDQFKSIRSSVDVNDFGSILASQDFNRLAQTVGSGIHSGKYKMSDLTGTINAVIECVQNDLDPEARSTVNSAVSIMHAAERGEQPDLSKLMGIIQSLKLN